jgi:hypothetical protein
MLGAVWLAAVLFTAAKTAYDFRNAPVEDAVLSARIDRYFAEHPGPFCLLQGVWQDWERDETMTLGCLEIKSRYLRQGTYKSETGPRATSSFSSNGTYDIDSDSSVRVTAIDQAGKAVRYIAFVTADNVEVPTQMVFVDEDGQRRLFIWKRDE